MDPFAPLTPRAAKRGSSFNYFEKLPRHQVVEPIKAKQTKSKHTEHDPPAKVTKTKSKKAEQAEKTEKTEKMLLKARPPTLDAITKKSTYSGPRFPNLHVPSPPDTSDGSGYEGDSSDDSMDIDPPMPTSLDMTQWNACVDCRRNYPASMMIEEQEETAQIFVQGTDKSDDVFTMYSCIACDALRPLHVGANGEEAMQLALNAIQTIGIHEKKLQMTGHGYPKDQLEQAKERVRNHYLVKVALSEVYHQSGAPSSDIRETNDFEDELNGDPDDCYYCRECEKHQHPALFQKVKRDGTLSAHHRHHCISCIQFFNLDTFPYSEDPSLEDMEFGRQQGERAFNAVLELEEALQADGFPYPNHIFGTVRYNISNHRICRPAMGGFYGERGLEVMPEPMTPYRQKIEKRKRQEEMLRVMYLEDLQMVHEKRVVKMQLEEDAREALEEGVPAQDVEAAKALVEMGMELD